jgi:hypothetical protein
MLFIGVGQAKIRDSFQAAQIMRLVLIWLTVFTGGCASMYFETLDEVPAHETPHPSAWPWQDYWTGIVFNGEKIGFSHQQFVPDQQRFRISSEAALRLRFLMIDKQFAFISHDWVDERLQLENLEYEYKIDQSRRFIKGQVINNELLLEVSNQAHTDKKVLAFEGELVPMNAVYLYPVLHGLEVGKVYNYQVFDGETLSIHAVEQTIEAYQSSELFPEKAFKVETEMMGLSTTTWIDVKGLPQFELSLRGTLISALEPEKFAKEYLTQAALSKSEHFLSYSLIPVQNKIENPRNLVTMRVRMSGMPESFEVINTSMQRCNKDNSVWLCQVQQEVNPTSDIQLMKKAKLEHYLLPSFTVNSTSKQISKLAEEIAGLSTGSGDQAVKIIDWMNVNIEKEVIDSFNSLDVLKQRKAECQGHSLLFAALARNMGIPTRLLNGVVYSDDYNAFLYHTWVESYIDNRWQAIDPTFGQRHADATHIALIEGEDIAQLTALLPLIGELEIEVE